MAITLDGQNLFDEQQLEIRLESVHRDSLVRTLAGLDGVMSVDLGQRGRIVKQKGASAAKSKQKMNTKISAISAFMDGDTHTLLGDSGEKFENLRVDAFKVTKEYPTGSGIACEYEIIYRQLVV